LPLPAGQFAQLAPRSPGEAGARQEWFQSMIYTALTLTAAREYRPFGEIGAACLEPVAARHGRAATPEQQREVGERMRQLPAHADATDAITRLREAGFGVVTLTNSVAAVAEDQLRNSGLRPLIDTVYSTDEVGRRKPYRHVLKSEQVEPAGAVLIAAHDWDIAGAAACGPRHGVRVPGRPHPAACPHRAVPVRERPHRHRGPADRTLRTLRSPQQRDFLLGGSDASPPRQGGCAYQGADRAHGVFGLAVRCQRWRSDERAVVPTMRLSNHCMLSIATIRIIGNTSVAHITQTYR
jgi:2-haloacid dehalogenase